MSPRPFARSWFLNACEKLLPPAHLTCRHDRTILAAMKFIAAIFFLALATATIVRAQDEEATNLPARTREMSVALFNQKDFSGWTFCMKDNADPAENLERDQRRHSLHRQSGRLSPHHADLQQLFPHRRMAVCENRAQGRQHRHSRSHPAARQNLADVRPGSGQTRTTGRYIFDGRRGIQGTQRQGRKHAGSAALATRWKSPSANGTCPKPSASATKSSPS